jgi:myo-inositol-1-phosphate synthase
MHLDIGGYHTADVDCVAAFDIAKAKVGQDLSEAIVAPPNNTARLEMRRFLALYLRYSGRWIKSKSCVS